MRERKIATEEIWLGLERVRGSATIARHRHDRSYAALVVGGGYYEAGDGGRRWVGPGEILVHARFDAHLNVFRTGGADILNLPCARDAAAMSARVDDPDLIVRLAERDLHEAADAMLEMLLPGAPAADDWPDMLARALDRDAVGSVSGWAVEMGIRPSSVSRGFALAYGVSPQRFRVERRARRALEQIAGGRPLAMLAADLGFADQSHMSREVHRLTGVFPSRFRRANCVQERCADEP